MLKFICTPKSVPTASLQSSGDLHTAPLGTSENFVSPGTHFPAEAEQGDALLPSFSSHIVTKCLFCGQINALFGIYLLISFGKFAG